jgi:hypothetical protein
MENNEVKELVNRVKGLRRLKNASIRYSEYISENLDKSISYSDYLSDLSDSYGPDAISYSSYLSVNVEKSTK